MSATDSTATETSETFILKVPDVGEGVAEVEIVTWTVAVGDTVARLQTVAEVMTDKATVDVPSPVDGVVSALGGAVGDVLLVGSSLMGIALGGGSGQPAPTNPALTNPAPTNPPPTEVDGPRPTKPPSGVEMRPHSTGAPEVDSHESPGGAKRSVQPPRAFPATSPAGPRALATPAVRRRARDHGVDLRRVEAAGFASGPAGRITHDDLSAFLTAGPVVSSQPQGGPGSRPAAQTGSSQHPVVGLRRRISQQMVRSVSTIPHITYVEEVDVTALEDLRAELNANANLELQQPRLTLLPFLVRAMVNSIGEYPHVNAHLTDDAAIHNTVTDNPATDNPADILTIHDGIHIGIATQTKNGLVVPVLRHAEAHTIWSTASAIGELSAATRDGTASADSLSGSTITITSLGPLGGVVTTPIINKPEVAIIGVNKIAVRPVWVDGAFVPRKVMNLSSSFDHRVIDGWDAASFIQSIRAQLEQPALLFIDRPG